MISKYSYMLKIFLVIFCFYLSSPSSVLAECNGRPSKCSGLNNEECQKKNDFKKVLCSLKAEIDKMQSMTSKDIKEVLGDSKDYSGSDDSIRISNQGEILEYSDPISASVSYIFIFNKEGFLRLATASQVLGPTSERTFFELDAFVE